MNKNITVLFLRIMNRKEEDTGFGVSLKKRILFVSGNSPDLKFFGIQSATLSVAIDHIVNFLIVPAKNGNTKG